MADRGLEGIQFKEIDRERKVHRKKHYFLRFLAVAAVAAAVYFFLRSSYFSVKHFEVEGNSYYTDKEVLAMAKVSEGENIIFDTKLSELEDNLLKDPYFREVEVHRKLPSTIKFTITERTQTAAVKYGDSYIVMDEDGTVLRRTDIMPEITLLTGLTISKMNVGEKLEAEEATSLSVTLRMLDAMREGDIYFKKIDVSKVMIRCYIYDTFLVKGTPTEILAAIRSGELQKVVATLFAQDISRGTIKMGGSDYMSFSPDIDSD